MTDQRRDAFLNILGQPLMSCSANAEGRCKFRIEKPTGCLILDKDAVMPTSVERCPLHAVALEQPGLFSEA